MILKLLPYSLTSDTQLSPSCCHALPLPSLLASTHSCIGSAWSMRQHGCKQTKTKGKKVKQINEYRVCGGGGSGRYLYAVLSLQAQPLPSCSWTASSSTSHTSGLVDLLDFLARASSSTSTCV